MEATDRGVRCGYVAAGWRSPAESGDADRRGAALWQALGAERGRLADPSVSDGNAEPVALVLHYSGYGYSPDGAPAWLADALENRPTEWRGARVVTFFHELFASGPPWRKVFWQSGRQRRVAERVARASDALMTNREQSAHWLEEAAARPPGSVPHLPVPSNVGEPKEVPPYDERPPQAVLFGGALHKRPFLTGRGARRTADVCRQLEIARITDIGAKSRIDTRAFESAGIDVVQAGYLAKEDVSPHLLSARIGFVSYFPGYLDKSGVFAAFTAHGAAILAAPAVEKDLRAIMGCDEKVVSTAGASRRAQIAMVLRHRCKSSAHASMLLKLSGVPTSVEVCA